MKPGRLYAEVHLSNLNLPRVHVYVDGDTMCCVGISFGNGSCDPVVLVDVELTGTRIGQIVGATYWWVRDRRGQ